MPKDQTENPIPQQWRDLGYSGSFTVMLGLKDEATGDPVSQTQIDGLKSRLPYEPWPDAGWLALAVEEVGGEPQVIMVRRDTAAIVDFVTGPRIGG